MKRLSPLAVLLLVACNGTVTTNEAGSTKENNNVVIEFSSSSAMSDLEQSSSVESELDENSSEVMLDADAEVQVDAEVQAGAEVQADADAQAGLDKQTGSYTAYYDGVIGNGEESVLFFHATWCPKCQQNEANLQAWYAENKYGRTVYKLDYDSNQQLKEEFGITSQDTFVLIDGNGEEIERVTFPSEEKLQELLG